jgi:hypothetical protein
VARRFAAPPTCATLPSKRRLDTGNEFRCIRGGAPLTPTRLFKTETRLIAELQTDE